MFRSGCGSWFAIPLLLIVGLVGAMFYALFTYTNAYLGPNGVFLLVGIGIGLPFLLMLIVLLGVFGLGTLHLLVGAVESNDGALQKMLGLTQKYMTSKAVTQQQPTWDVYNDAPYGLPGSVSGDRMLTDNRGMQPWGEVDAGRRIETDYLIEG